MAGTATTGGRWVSLSEAADLGHEPDRAALIRDFDATPLED